MMEPVDQFLTTKELAEILRIKERKVYELAANGDVPCVRVVGKLLFPKTEIYRWLSASQSGPLNHNKIPSVMVGSHDPLLEWALRESGCGIAAMFDGSFDGLKRFANGEALACSLHIYEDDSWNVKTVEDVVGDRPVVLINFAERQRGLIVAKGNPKAITNVTDLAGIRFGHRQENSASSRIFQSLAQTEGFDTDLLVGPQVVARTEDDVAMMVLQDEVDAALGLKGVAVRLGLGFVPILKEQFDLLVWQHAFFEPPLQKFMNFLQTDAFMAKAAGLAGYDVQNIGSVQLNGAAR